MDWNLTLGTNLPARDEVIDRIMDSLERQAVAITTLDHDPDHLAVIITVTAANLPDAIQIGLLAARAADLGEITWLEASDVDTFDGTHEGAGPAIPELVSLGTAAEALGISRNTARRRIGAELVGTNIDGPGWVVTKASLDRALAAATAR